MANTISDIMPTIYAALDVVSRELIGFVPNVMRDATAQSGAVGQTVRSPVVPSITTENITPGADPADSGDQTIGYTDVAITKSKAAPIRWTGEEQLALSRDGVINTVLRDQFAQGFRALANEVETDIGALYVSASRAYGTAGATPFATANDMTDFAGVNRILDENGAPAMGRKLIVGSAARANLEGKQSQLFKVNEAADAGALLRERQMRQLMGFTMGFSSGVMRHTKGTAAASPNYLIDQASSPAGYAVGDTTIHIDTGSGTHVAGDLFVVAGDANKYIIGTGSASSGDKDIVLNAPGLLLPASDGAEVADLANYTANLAFSENAIVLAARVPAMPSGGDSADDVTTITDPISGLTFQVAMYRQYRRVKYEIGLAWGVKCVKPEHLAILLG